MNEKIINIEFDSSGNQLLGKEKYYTSEEILNLIDVKYSTLRYWWQTFEDFLDVKQNDNPKRFSEVDLEVLKIVKQSLREQKLSIKQVQEYLSKNIDMLRNKVILNFEAQQIMKVQAFKSIVQNEIKNNVELAMKSMSGQMATFVSEQMKIQSQELLSQNEQLLKENLELQSKLQQQTKKEITDMVSDELKTAQNQFKSEIGNLALQVKESEQKSMKRDIEMSNLLKENMALRKKEHQEKEKKKKGFFAKIFG